MQRLQGAKEGSDELISLSLIDRGMVSGRVSIEFSYSSVRLSSSSRSANQELPPAIP